MKWQKELPYGMVREKELGQTRGVVDVSHHGDVIEGE